MSSISLTGNGEAIKYLIGVGDLLTGYLLTFDALIMEFHKVKLPRRILMTVQYAEIIRQSWNRSTTSRRVCEETAGRFATRDEQ